MSSPGTTAIDPITFSVLLNRLGTIATEMGVAISHTASSALLALSHDFSCTVYDGQGRQVAMKDALPIHTNSMHLVLDRIIEAFGDDIGEGDAIACNDPYSGNTHIGDLAIATPVFHDGELLFWTAIRAHQLDVGAPAPTSAWAGAKNVWQEGLILPPVKVFEGGVPRRDVIGVYLANVRWRDMLEGDLLAQIGAARVGARKLQELAVRYGSDTMRKFCDEAIEYGARRAAAEIEAMPDGTYHGEAWYDFGPETGEPDVRCTVTIAGDTVEVDFTGSAAQHAGSMNATYGVLQAAGGIPLLMAIDPDIPHNEGCLRRVKVTAPEGTLCNAAYPAATALATVLPGDVMQEAVTRALVHAIPERVAAGNCHLSNVPMLTGVDPRTGVYWGFETWNGGGGGGAAPGADGWPMHGCNGAQGGLHCAPVESTELLRPVVFEHWELEPDSMGLGEWIGGAGARSAIRPLHDVSVIYCCDGQLNPPCGLLGGTPGAGGGSYIEERESGRRRFLGREVYAQMTPDEVWVGVSTGGGGYGDPLNRSPERVREDVRGGIYSAAAAREVFGVVLAGGGDLAVDVAATDAARARIVADREGRPLPVALPDRRNAAGWIEKTLRPGDVIAPVPSERGL
jgi:N-methylhydantoinase B